MTNPVRGVCVLSAILLTLAAPSRAFAQNGFWTPEIALRTKVIQDLDISPDGKWVVFSVTTAVTEGDASAWETQLVLAAADGSRKILLTNHEKNSTAPQFTPDGQWVAFLSARHSSSTNIWRIRVDGGEAEALTRETGNVASFRFSPDGKHVAFVAVDPKSPTETRNEQTKNDAYLAGTKHRVSRLYYKAAQADTANGSYVTKRISRDNEHVSGGNRGIAYDWSPDSRKVVYSHQSGSTANDWDKGDISLFDMTTNMVRSLVQTQANETQPTFSPDGQWIAFTQTDIPARWGNAYRTHLVSPDGAMRRALAKTFDEQPRLLGWTADSQSLLVAETRRTCHGVMTLPIAEGSTPVPFGPVERMVSNPVVNRGRTHLAFVSETPELPPEVFHTKLGEFKPLQVSRIQQLPNIPLGKTSVITWKSNDGREIEGLLTLPAGFQTGRRVPLVLVVHGGPMGVFTQSFIGGRGHQPLATWATRGVAILRANPRGSSGYGREFRYANYKDWGVGDYQDLISGVDAVVSMGVADPNRLGIAGWSYGGYMSAWTVTQTTRFRAAVIGAPVINLTSFTGTSDIPGFIPDYMESEFWEQSARWAKHSPITHVAQVKTPSLLLHGDRDARVPITQSYEFYHALKRRDAVTEMVVYPRQGHSVDEPKLIIDCMNRHLQWFEKWLR